MDVGDSKVKRSRLTRFGRVKLRSNSSAPPANRVADYISITWRGIPDAAIGHAVPSD